MPDPILNPALYTRAHIFGRGAPSSPNFVEQGFGGSAPPPQPVAVPEWLQYLLRGAGYGGGQAPQPSAVGGPQASWPTASAPPGPQAPSFPGGAFGGGMAPQPSAVGGPQASWPTPPAAQPSFPGAAFGGGGPVPQPSAVGGPQPSWPTPPPSMLRRAVVSDTPPPAPSTPSVTGPTAAPASRPNEGRGGGPGAPAMGGTVAPADPRLQYGVPMPPSRPPDLSPLFNQNQGAGMGMTPFMLAREGANWGGGRDARG